MRVRLLALAERLQGAGLPVAAALGVAVLRIDLGEHAPGAHRRRGPARLVIPPAALPEIAGAGLVEGIDPPQQAQGVDRRVEQVGVEEVLVEAAQGVGRELQPGLGAHQLGEGDRGGVRLARLGHRQHPLPFERGALAGVRGHQQAEHAERLAAVAAAGEAARLQQVPLEIALLVGNLVQGEDRRPRAVAVEERLGAAQHVLGGEQTGPVEAAVRSAEGVHDLHGVGGERIRDQDPAARLALHLGVLQIAADLPGQPVEVLAQLAVDLRLAGAGDQAEGHLRLALGGELRRLQEGGRPQRRVRIVGDQAGVVGPRGGVVAALGGALGEHVEPPVVERAARGRIGREELAGQPGVPRLVGVEPGDDLGLGGLLRMLGGDRVELLARLLQITLAQGVGGFGVQGSPGAWGCCWRPDSWGRTMREAAG